MPKSKSYVTHPKKHRKKNTDNQIKKEKTADLNTTYASDEGNNNSGYLILFLIVVVVVSILAFVRSNSLVNNNPNPGDPKDESFITDSLRRMFMSRRDYYNDVYLKSDEWKRKRYVVLRRDSWRCVYCGRHATQVHHKKYAKRNIGKEPIDWLVSICKSCHDIQHR